MARTALLAANIHAMAVTGLNVTAGTLTVQTMVLGDNNGVEIPYSPKRLILLRNDSGASATYTFKVKQPAEYTAIGSTIPDMTVTVVDDADWLVPINGLFNQSGDEVYVDCSVAGKIAAIDPA